MKFSIMLVGETEEPVETRSAAETIAKNTAETLGLIGYHVDDVTVDFGDDLPWVDKPQTANIVPVHIEPGWGIASVPEPTLKERILALRGAADNGINSQREIAAALGITRYEVRKALAGA